jgi:fructokinase
LRSSENRESLRRLLRRSSAQRFLDLNLRSPHDALEALVGWLEGATWIKLNLDEFTRLAGEQTDFADAATVRQQADRLRARYGVANVLLTAGSQGARITGEAGEASFLPAPEPEPLRDTVGAGDAFSAFTINGLLTGAPLDELIAGASRFAAKVCGLRGATSDQTSFYETT